MFLYYNMSVELKIDEIDKSDHENKIVGREEITLNDSNINDATNAAKKLNLDSVSNEKPEEIVEETVNDDEKLKLLLIKKLLEEKENLQRETTIEEDLKNISSKLIKKHIVPSLKNFLSNLD